VSDIQNLIEEHRDKFCAVPNLIYEMGLDAYEIALYSAIKRSAGDNGECTRSTSTLAQNAGMSVGKVSAVKQSLVNRGLIAIEEMPSKRGRQRHQIRVNPLLWIANDVYFLLDKSDRPKGKLIISWDQQIAISSPRELISSRDEVISSPGEVISSPGEVRKNLSSKNLDSKNLEENVGADAPASPPASEDDDDLDPDEVFTPSEHKKNEKPYTPRYHKTNDAFLGIVGASDLGKERQVPDWAVLGPEGTDPAFPVAKAFCELTGQSTETLGKKRGKGLLRHYAKLSQEHDLTLEHMAQAHDVLRGENWGKWHLDHHKWSTGFEDKYIDQLVLAAGQIRDGRLKSNGDGEIVEDVPDEILAQGRGYAAIMAHQRLKDKAARERGESVPESMWPSIRELEARERESQEEGQ